jgi:L1 cell adhesion molecule like protein
MKTSLNDENISSKISADDKSKINETIESTLKWMDANQSAEKEEFEHQRKEVEKICSPIMTKLYRK